MTRRAFGKMAVLTAWWGFVFLVVLASMTTPKTLLGHWIRGTWLDPWDASVPDPFVTK